MEMDSQLFDQCSAQLDEREGKQQHTCEERRRKWLQLETRASLASVAIPRVWFSYQKLRFCVYATMDDDEGAATMVFHRLSYPTTHALQYYTQHTGYHSLAELNAASARWQDNEFDIPMPEFWELLKQHLVAAFFVFQVNEAMLSGESIPLRKEMLDVSQYDADTVFNMDENVATVKKHILYGGTKGNLMRTILFSAQRVTANNMESMLFILCLLCFALVASGMVLHQGLQDPTRNTFKLFLHCVMIITSVVPPELPMELSLAVTNSLLSLSKRNIFCTEPFRIPFAGKVDVVCFDKTGTLTSDALEMHGVAGLLATSVVPLDNPVQLVAPTALPTSVQLILAGCHSLMVVDGKVLGDPLETTILSHVKWNLRPGDVLVPHWSFSPGPKSMKIVHRYAFSSELKRMMYTHYAMKGCRVLALGSKSLSTRDLQRFKTIARSTMETDLVFGGFVVLDCPLK
ncbi:hypothetical protein DYB28_004372, partial [Aphanomyces astaci]